MSVGSQTTTAAWLAFLLSAMPAAAREARSQDLASSVQDVSSVQDGVAQEGASGGAQELAGPSRREVSPRSVMARVPRPPVVELSSDAYVSGLVPAIAFAPGSAKLTPSATRILDNLGSSLNAPGLAVDRFRVEGHTDTTGSWAANRDLATRRAAAVVAYLEQNCGVAAARLEAVAALKPLAPTGDGVALSLNRRIRLVNLGP